MRAPLPLRYARDVERSTGATAADTGGGVSMLVFNVQVGAVTVHGGTSPHRRIW